MHPKPYHEEDLSYPYAVYDDCDGSVTYVHLYYKPEIETKPKPKPKTPTKKPKARKLIL